MLCFFLSAKYLLIILILYAHSSIKTRNPNYTAPSTPHRAFFDKMGNKLHFPFLCWVEQIFLSFDLGLYSLYFFVVVVKSLIIIEIAFNSWGMCNLNSLIVQGYNNPSHIFKHQKDQFSILGVIRVHFKLAHFSVWLTFATEKKKILSAWRIQ